MEEFVGKTLGKFEVRDLIGQGGMAWVFSGHQASINRTVAIKILFPQYSLDESFVKRFENEARLIAQLEHIHILPVIDFGNDSGTLYIVMRYLDAGSLKDRIRSGGLELPEVHRLFIQIATALDYAHSKGVVHRDLKPANILIDQQGNTFLTDFGIAKLVEGDEQLTGTGGVVGTPNYMSPEQGMAVSVDARSDIYSLGVLLFEMLTGKLPFVGAGPMAVMLKHMNEPPPVPSAINNDLHPAFDRIILRALAKRPEDRFQTASEMIEAVEQAIGLATGASPDTLRTVGAEARAAAAQAARTGHAAHGAATLAVEPVTIAPTVFTTWINARGSSLGLWLRATILSLVTFLIIQRIAPGSPLEVGLLSLLPGLLLYGLLRATTLGTLSAFVLIMVPLLVRSPGLGLLWAVVTIVVGARLHAQEMLLTLVTAGIAGVPFVGLVIPLVAPWWLRSRRTVLPLALGVGLAMLFATTLGWPTAGGLLPTLELPAQLLVGGDRAGSFLDLFDPRLWPTADQIVPSLGAIMRVIGASVLTPGSAVLPIMAAWALAASLSVSNRRVQSSALRAAGIGAGALLLLVAHLGPTLGVVSLPVLILYVADAALLTYVLTQWPLQVDPNAGNLPVTVQRMLRNALGALFVALGAAGLRPVLAQNMTLNVLAMLLVAATLWMTVTPAFGGTLALLCLLVLSGPISITFAPLEVRMVAANLDAALAVVLLLGLYLGTNLLFDRRRPRRWNPIGAGALVGVTRLAPLGLLGVAPLSMGLLEAQIPAAIFAIGAHVALWLRVGFPSGVGVVVQVVAALLAVLLPQRLMDTPILASTPPKPRRLLFALLTMLALFPAYYLFGGVGLARESVLPVLYALNVAVAGLLVLAMGDAATTWVSVDEGDLREEEDMDPDTAA